MRPAPGRDCRPISSSRDGISLLKIGRSPDNDHHRRDANPATEGTSTRTRTESAGSPAADYATHGGDRRPWPSPRRRAATVCCTGGAAGAGVLPSGRGSMPTAGTARGHAERAEDIRKGLQLLLLNPRCPGVVWKGPRASTAQASKGVAEHVRWTRTEPIDGPPSGRRASSARADTSQTEAPAPLIVRRQGPDAGDTGRNDLGRRQCDAGAAGPAHHLHPAEPGPRHRALPRRRR